MKTVPLCVLVLSAVGGTAACAAPKEPPLPLGVFSGDYKDAPARIVMTDIAKAAGKNVVIPSDLEGNVTAHFHRVPAMKAFATVAGTANADYRMMDDTITVIKRSVVIRPRVEPGQMTAREVDRAVRRIDEEDGLYPARAPRRRAEPQPVQVQTYINIQTAPAYPQPYAQPYVQPYPVYQPYGYGYGYGFGGPRGYITAPYGSGNSTRFYPIW